MCGFLPALCPGQRAANRIPARPKARSSIAQLLIPVGSAARGGEVVQVPERLDGADVAGILPGLGWRVESSEPQKWRIVFPSRWNTFSIGR